MIEAGTIDLTDAEGSLLHKETWALTEPEARQLRAVARMLRTKRFRMLIRCDACFEENRADGMRGEITRSHVQLECRCRWITYTGETL